MINKHITDINRWNVYFYDFEERTKKGVGGRFERERARERERERGEGEIERELCVCQQSIVVRVFVEVRYVVKRVSI